MRKRPWPVVVVCVMFLLAGSVGFLYHLPEVFTSGDQLFEVIWVEVVRLIAIVCAVLLWRGVNWARWLALSWLVYHVYIGSKHSSGEAITHVVLLIVVGVLIYLPRSSVFFRINNVTEI